ncbi:MAG: hypothetical protein PUC54_07010 [Clostridiales bacterium]|nr:hypothetical protein [Clostridiales bacterium]
MKKIFAIALALVMVLSMASAFASACVTGPFDWACATTTNKCGKATVEVVPYVTTNAACNELSYVQSSCAAAINGENVYYALKITIDKDVDPEWFATATFKYSIAGMQKNVEKTALPMATDIEVIKAAYPDDSKDGWVFYAVLKNGAFDKWVEATEDDDFDIADVMNKSVVKEYAKAKVCLYLDATYEPGMVTVGNYKITYAGGKLVVATKDDNKTLVTYTIKDEKVTAINYTSVCGEADYATIKAFMGLEIGTCVTEDAINKNFGWDESTKSCFQWSKNGTAVVDPECKIEIPKTGDVSVVAYAVMALVAAAGAMGLKK